MVVRDDEGFYKAPVLFDMDFADWLYSELYPEDAVVIIWAVAVNHRW